ncbi:hypothetical protein DVA67_032520 [Solirubrobacter sp. CPCC 204708]|uniref:Glycosyl hydrolase n=1 Tax=Solirubrobacter deserti TaxID=2282478 RepID=A0ABT4RV61_9ACTN|nr:glycosyl hydrolase [Solirubrobacter deserti]MBE2320729.1 hypothetical protein [Solirubrobacter deserti]MDA0142340.1 glycosyl hydrolase [Solirubrobacter deserti]
MGQQRKRVAVAAALVGAVAAWSAPAVAHALGAGSAFAERLNRKFIDPDRVYSSDIRWWLGEASNTDESLLEEVQALYDGGFRGVELAMMNDAGAPDATYAYGSAMWTHKWNLLMNKLLDLGMGVYLTSGTNWNTSNVPGLDPDSQSAMQNLTLGTSTVQAGQSLTALPAPAANARRAGAKFVTAYAYKVTSGNTVDPNSFVNLPAAQGADVWTQNVNWTAPGEGTYRVFALWTQGTYQASSPSTLPAYATNYFDERGVQALREYWEDHYLSDPALVEKFKQGDVQLFMDSLEMSTGTGGITWWAEDMKQEFQRRKGYDITPHLFLIAGVNASVSTPYHSVGTTGTYRLDGAEQRRQRIVNDYQDVLTQLYNERMLKPLKEWLNSVGIKTRGQISYGRPLEISEPGMYFDYPEAENFNQYNQVDIFRLWTGGAKLENKVLSTETGAELAYNGTRQTNLQDAYAAFAAGYQRHIWHIWGAGYGYGSFQWPGFIAAGFLSNFQYWGTRNPESAGYDEFNAHIGRVQQLMQTGKSRTDVGFLHQNWTQGVRFGGGTGSNNTQMHWQLAHQGVYYRSVELQDNGYTYDYFSPRFLFDDDVSFNEQTKTIEKAGYKAVVIYQNWLDLEGAERIRDWAQKGLKVVILGNAATQTPYNDGKDAELAAVMAELKSLPTVRTATVADAPADYFGPEPGGYDDNVLEKLQELGVDPYAGYARPNEQLLTQTREDAEGNRYLYVYNYEDGSYRDKSLRPEIRTAPNPGTNIKTDVKMDGRFVPYAIDAWTGEATELADYRWEHGKTVVAIDLDFNDIALLAFEKVDAPKLRVVSHNADSARAIPNGVTVRSTASKTVTAQLSNGVQLSRNVTVPAPYDITDWDLTVESWRPNATAGDLVRTETIEGVTTVNRKTSTVKTPIDVELDTLKTWDQIPEVGRGVSGTGHYEASFDWDATKASGAYLDFGDKVEASMEVWINGRKVGGQVSTHPTKVKRDVAPFTGKELFTGGINSTHPVADVSRYLVHGRNRIVIDYHSALVNVQLDRGIVNPTPNYRSWWGYDLDYLPFGPKQARLVPFVDVGYASTTTDGTVGGSVPATLSLSLAAPKPFEPFVPGVDRTYETSTTANVISTAGDAALTVDGGRLANGSFTLSEPLQVAFSKASWTAPVSNDPVTVTFKQHIGRTEPLRTGNYSKTLTFTLSTTTP